MNNFKNILQKLEGFIRRFYVNELIKGTILFFSIGLLYLIITLLIEQFLWLNTTARTVLFWLFVIVELVLFAKFIVVPLTKLFKLQRGINYEEASRLIGNHFPEVNDKLLNVLQLSKNQSQSDLLLASIDQKSLELSPIPFKLAINFRHNVKYLKYACIPVFIIFLAIVLGKMNWFTDSYKRVVDYRTAYEPPAPFQFFVINDSLQTLENTDFKLLVKTVGNVVPEQAEIHFNNETYLLTPSELGGFEYVFSRPKQDISFQLQANGVSSKPYTLQLVEVPKLIGFDMVLDYPAYTQKQDEVLKSSGNAIIPEGTKVSWILNTKSTNQVQLFANDTVVFKKQGNTFEASKTLHETLNYSLSTSNTRLKNYEELNFSLEVVKDDYPEMKVEMVKDTVDLSTMYFRGQLSDDYGLHKLRLAYYKTDDVKGVQYIEMPVSKSNVDEFISAFPDQLTLEPGTAYSLHYEVFDNDVLHGYKRTKSETFYYRQSTASEQENKQLQQQQESINNLSNSLETFEKNEKQLQELNQSHKANQRLNFSDKKKLENIIQNQKQQEQLMKRFNKSFQDNLEEFQKNNQEQDASKDELNKRLKEHEEQLKQDEKLLQELEELQDKINNDDLNRKLDQLSKQNKNQKRSLEQLLELTKRFYVAKKMEKLQEDIDQLANDQLKLSEENDDNTSKKQEDLNKRFEDITKQLDSLAKDNKDLKKPMDLPRDEVGEEDVKSHQQDAKSQLEQSEKQELNSNQDTQKSKAKQKQKQAGQKMKQMSQQMQSAMQMDSGEQLEEDAEMLRQILDNVLLFSFDEEALMNDFKRIQVNHNKYASYLRKQHDLRAYFEHVDDSLFALSLRQPMLSEQVNTEISNVYYNIDKSLDEFSENRIYQGVSSQQYAFTAANTLADMLSNILDNMEDQLNASSSSSGKGSKNKQSQGEGQLQDIIMSQQELNKQMQKGLQKQQGEGQGESEGKEQGQQSGNKPNASGKQSESKGQGSEGLNGELYQIYQKQQELRFQLENQLKQSGLNTQERSLIRQMENIEMDLINNGITKETMEKMIHFEHQLLKLEDATFKQNQDTKRESETNQQQFQNITNSKIPDAKQYFNTTEILNRQVIPLQQLFKLKVQQYFNNQ
ncbi:hypothetical protein [Formosa sp. A9]|uniref:hypothetical protein n=1 Tax=Formosa sp. A9 TaxID=3442641 RepID=UPI003EC0F2CF